MSETVDVKAIRLVRDERVQLLEDGDPPVYEVEGDHAYYQVTVYPDTGTSCTCPAWGRCSHQVAVVLYRQAKQEGIL